MLPALCLAHSNSCPVIFRCIFLQFILHFASTVDSRGQSLELQGWPVQFCFQLASLLTSHFVLSVLSNLLHLKWLNQMPTKLQWTKTCYVLSIPFLDASNFADLHAWTPTTFKERPWRYLAAPLYTVIEISRPCVASLVRFEFILLIAKL